jgi:uncharacterized protein (TIGR03083 family)
MYLTPRYGTDPVLVLDGSPAEVFDPAVRQRQRLVDAVSSFTDEQWAHPSRCAGWSSRDVIAHLDSTNAFWAFSISGGLRGEPTQLLATFDPVSTPAGLVAAVEGVSPGDILARFRASTESLVELLASLDADDWSAPAEAPPGHLSISAVVHHALWDSWVHERDILLPLGIAPVEEADEIAACLRYAAALGPAFALTNGHSGTGAFAVDATDPRMRVAVEIGERVVVRDAEVIAEFRLTGGAVELLEELSIRKPRQQPVPAASAWMVDGLAEAFDAAEH